MEVEKADRAKQDYEARIKELEEFGKSMKTKLAYQVAENDNTIKRYRKLQADEKIFAISKFAKDLLDVRDALDLGMQHVNLEEALESEDIE